MQTRKLTFSSWAHAGQFVRMAEKLFDVKARGCDWIDGTAEVYTGSLSVGQYRTLQMMAEANIFADNIDMRDFRWAAGKLREETERLLTDLARMELNDVLEGEMTGDQKGTDGEAGRG